MKNTAPSQQPTHTAKLTIHTPSEWKGTDLKTTRCRMADSFNFLMGLIGQDSFTTSTNLKKIRPHSKMLNLQSH